jgi:hypothetical protein
LQLSGEFPEIADPRLLKVPRLLSTPPPLAALLLVTLSLLKAAFPPTKFARAPPTPFGAVFPVSTELRTVRAPALKMPPPLELVVLLETFPDATVIDPVFWFPLKLKSPPPPPEEKALIALQATVHVCVIAEEMDAFLVAELPLTDPPAIVTVPLTFAMPPPAPPASMSRWVTVQCAVQFNEMEEFTVPVAAAEFPDTFDEASFRVPKVLKMPPPALPAEIWSWSKVQSAVQLPIIEKFTSALPVAVLADTVDEVSVTDPPSL